MKTAMTLDGKIAACTGDSKWVTGEESRRAVQEMRNRLTGIMVESEPSSPTIRGSPAGWKADGTR